MKGDCCTIPSFLRFSATVFPAISYVVRSATITASLPGNCSLNNCPTLSNISNPMIRALVSLADFSALSTFDVSY